MDRSKYLLLAIASCFACQSPKITSQIKAKFTTFPISSSVRALQVIDSNTVWYAGTGGQFGYTEDGGSSWHIDSIQIGDTLPEFRSIAVTSQAVFLLSIASPARLFKSADKGKTWSLVYREAREHTFYDSMAFWDDQNGIAIGDPTDSCLSVILTTDGGEIWQKLPCPALPPIDSGEYAFAASNTNIALHGQHAWVVTGGIRARVFHSPDRGQTWEVFDTPIRQGGDMTGIFTVDFYDENQGVIFGGDWENQDQNTQTKARTNDGGQTWQLFGEGEEPSFRSCVQFVPGSKGQELFAVGMPGISYSADGGKTWKLVKNDPFFTIRVSQSGRVAWLAGKHKISKMQW